MPQIDRRTFLRGSAATAGAVMLGGPFQGFVARAANAASPKPSFPLGPVEDMRDGIVRLWLPKGFHYRSFHDTETPVTLRRRHGAPGPPRRDGGVPRAGRELCTSSATTRSTVRARAFGPGTPYDAAARGGTTTIEVTPKGKVVDAFTSLNGTQMNCSGGPMPWGSWITCEETVNGPDVGAGLHRRVERAAPAAARVHLRGAGGRAVDPRADHGGGQVRPRSGGVRSDRRDPLPDRGQLRRSRRASTGTSPRATRWTPAPSTTRASSRCSAVVGQPNLVLAAAQTAGCDVRRRMGRHRRPGADVPVHARRSRRPRRTTRRSSTSGTRAGRRAPPTSRAWRDPSTRTASSTSLRRRAEALPRRSPSLGPTR